MNTTNEKNQIIIPKENTTLYASDYPEETDEHDLKAFFKGYSLINCQFIK